MAVLTSMWCPFCKETNYHYDGRCGKCADKAFEQERERAVEEWRAMSDQEKLDWLWERASGFSLKTLQQGGDCSHNWVSGDNEVVSGAEICTKCKTIRTIQQGGGE